MAVLTIIVPVYRGRELFWKTYNSIAQSAKVTIIVVERESDDEIGHQDLDPSTVYITQSGKGQYAAIREGLARATTHYVTWVNTGDISLITSSLLEDLAMIPTESAVIVFNRSWHDDRQYQSQKNIVKKQATVRGEYNGVTRRYLQAEAMVFTKDAFARSDAFVKYDLAGDFYLWIDIFSSVDKIIRIKRPLFSFLLHEGRSVKYKQAYTSEISPPKGSFILYFLRRFFQFASYSRVSSIKKSVTFEFSIFEPPLSALIIFSKLKDILFRR